LGLGVGLGSLDIQQEQNPASGLGIGAGIWYLVSSLIALFAAGWIADRLAQTRRIFDGALHGILTWCVITIVSIYFFSSTIGGIIGGVGRMVGNTLGAVGQVSGSVLEMAAPAIKQEAQSMDLSELQKDGTAKEVIDLFKKADGDPSRINRGELVDVIVKTTDKSREEATKTADTLMSKYEEMSAEWQATKEEVMAKAEKTADDVAAAASTTFILAFIAFLIGAGAAGFGAKLGTESKSNPHYQTTAYA
jgi:phosphotransferase system  glucose/maltose/N-acetylglucosamine-specific IIC component